MLPQMRWNQSFKFGLKVRVQKLTKEFFVLKCLSESRKFSVRQAPIAIEVSNSQINHAENGR